MTSRCYLCKERLYDGQTLVPCNTCPEKAVLCELCARSPFATLGAAVERWQGDHRCTRLKRGGGLEVAPA